MLKIPIIWADAINWFGKDNAYLDWTRNDPSDTSQMPAPGDIVVWGTDTKVGTGVAGHIDIVVSPTGTAFVGFDQNWPVNSPCHLQQHSYEGVIGWGHPKSTGGNTQMPPSQPSEPGWKTWETLGGNVSAIHPIATPDGILHVFAIGTEGNVWHTQYEKPA